MANCVLTLMTASFPRGRLVPEPDGLESEEVAVGVNLGPRGGCGLAGVDGEDVQALGEGIGDGHFPLRVWLPGDAHFHFLHPVVRRPRLELEAAVILLPASIEICQAGVRVLPLVMGLHVTAIEGAIPDDAVASSSRSSTRHVLGDEAPGLGRVVDVEVEPLIAQAPRLGIPALVEGIEGPPPPCGAVVDLELPAVDVHAGFQDR